MLTGPEMMGLSFRWPHAVVVVLGPIVTVSVLGGLLLAVSLLLSFSPGYWPRRTFATNEVGSRSGSTQWTGMASAAASPSDATDGI